jgi:hypothetical protein
MSSFDGESDVLITSMDVEGMRVCEFAFGCEICCSDRIWEVMS